MDKRRTRILLEIALTIALATVLGMFTVWRMPQGGSVSLEMLPIFVLALRRGLGPGVVAGALYGLVDLMVNPFIVHWAQLLLDYPVAYLLVGLAGLGAGAVDRELARGRRLQAAGVMTAGIAAGSAARYLAHVISGVIFFSEYAPAGQPVWAYSAVYNLYVPVAAAGCLVAALVIVPSLDRILPASEGPGRP